MLNNDQLPFLDTLVTFNPQNKTFSTILYMKPIHSRCITPWESHGSVAFKRAIFVGETKRAIRCSTDSESQKLSLKLIKPLFIDNGYPNRFVKRVIRNTVFERRQQCENQEEFLYLKLTFINEEHKRRALSVINRSNVKIQFSSGASAISEGDIFIYSCSARLISFEIESTSKEINCAEHEYINTSPSPIALAPLLIQFMNGRPLSKVFAPPKNKQDCPRSCETRKLSTKRGCCLTKNVVYEIKFSTCGAAYMGKPAVVQSIKYKVNHKI